MSEYPTAKTLSSTMSTIIESLGTFRRFGNEGPVYEIIGDGPTSNDDIQLIRIRVLESGEELDYPLSQMLLDPYAE